MVKVTAERGKYPGLFGGLGYHNNEAILYPIIEKEHFDQLLCKCYREMSPGFMRTFAGYDDWTKEAMDDFAEYYNKMQKWTDTPMYFAAAKGKIHFSDEEIRDYCERVAENLKYLKQEKGVNHLRYYCFSNEMSQGTWGDLINDLPLFKKYHENLYRSFQNRDLNIGLLATDASELKNWKTMDWAIENMPRITEDYCLHHYEKDHSVFDPNFYSEFYDICYEYVQKAIRSDNKRFILGEVGFHKCESRDEDHNYYGKGVVIDTNHWWDDDFERAYYGIGMTDFIFAAINAGVFALALWSYTDYPDPYSCAYAEKDEYAAAWGRIERFISGTTDAKYNKVGFFKWEDDGDHSIREFYWCLAPLTKLFKRNSKVLDIETNDELLHCCGILNRDGSVSIGIINRNEKEVEIELSSSLFNKDVRLYEYDPRNVPSNKFGDIQDYSDVLPPDGVKFTLKRESVTFFTTDYEEKEAPVYAKNLKVSDTTLFWDETDDKNHCYYRVYASDNPDFVPCRENQIASTVATDIPITDNRLYYKVLSVDTYGNI